MDGASSVASEEQIGTQMGLWRRTCVHAYKLDELSTVQENESADSKAFKVVGS